MERLGLRSAILTATNLRRRRFLGVSQTAQMRHFGFIARRDSLGAWHFENHSETLAPAERTGAPRIFEADGTPATISRPPTGA